VNVVVLQVFVSLMLVAGSLVLFVHSVRDRTSEHADRLALAPLEEDSAGATTSDSATPPKAAADTTKENACKRNG
jgi:hypothetical protein